MGLRRTGIGVGTSRAAGWDVDEDGNGVRMGMDEDGMR